METPAQPLGVKRMRGTAHWTNHPATMNSLTTDFTDYRITYDYRLQTKKFTDYRVKTSLITDNRRYENKLDYPLDDGPERKMIMSTGFCNHSQLGCAPYRDAASAAPPTGKDLEMHL